jgi:DNA-directed RNA polymerase specialized sigma24 family protein
VIDIDNALRELELLDPTLAQVVEMRYFGGYTDAEVASAMEISDRTVRRHWDKARAFMLAQLQA